MVYYGAVSRGCQRCRQRKIKCDQRKPDCLRCEKSKLSCPGYRDLNQVVFRDECERIVRLSERARNASASGQHPTEIKRAQRVPISGARTPHNPETDPSSKALPAESLSSPTQSIPPMLTQPPNEIAASFFFLRYALVDHPFAGVYQEWIRRSYFCEDRSNSPLRAIIRAIGLAGISNISGSSYAKTAAKRQYCEAVTALKQDLDIPSRAVADCTLGAVILLGIFEVVNFETWDRYHRWQAHLHGALALLELRGMEQFSRHLGVQLYVQIRSQVILSCMQQHIAIPPALVKATCAFQASEIRSQWQRSNIASPASICELSFRIVNLRAAVKGGDISDSSTIRALALDIDGDLREWREIIPPKWRYVDVLDRTAVHDDNELDGRRHEYPNAWVAEIWNTWRSLRILVNRVLIENGMDESGLDRDSMVSVIQQMSFDICVSASSFVDAPSTLFLVQPLYLVSMEDLNPHHIRLFATKKIRCIGETSGIRMARLLAETAASNLGLAPTSGVFDAGLSNQHLCDEKYGLTTY
ncbi:hypothetical protein VTK73DRAFT_576 [Phialemonium thermophilum]|uniref:Zn(2)-C6 fungal-type domain-containing protein n=1 Tax=Phialemonium thermophilum TaxID=223376 RepID=A0ABR3XDH6_9PEZI